MIAELQCHKRKELSKDNIMLTQMTQFLQTTTAETVLENPKEYLAETPEQSHNDMFIMDINGLRGDSPTI